MTEGERIAAALGRIADAIDRHAQSVDGLARSTRLIAMGEKEPTGIEALTMSLTGGGLPGLRGTPDSRSIAGSLQEIAESLRERR
jgi:hypothetical protein